MLKLIYKWILFAFALLLVAKVIPGIQLDGIKTALLVAIVIGLINIFIKPLIMLLALPINILTLGFFTLIVNALMLWLSAAIVAGFEINGFWAAFLGSISLSALSMIINKL